MIGLTQLFNWFWTASLAHANKYVYSDLDFIFLGKVVEAVSKMPLDEYVQKTFYKPLGMKTTGFKPLGMFNMIKLYRLSWILYFAGRCSGVMCMITVLPFWGKWQVMQDYFLMHGIFQTLPNAFK